MGDREGSDHERGGRASRKGQTDGSVGSNGLLQTGPRPLLLPRPAGHGAVIHGQMLMDGHHKAGFSSVYLSPTSSSAGPGAPVESSVGENSSECQAKLGQLTCQEDPRKLDVEGYIQNTVWNVCTRAKVELGQPWRDRLGTPGNIPQPFILGGWS